jgi:hypothetical protein
MAGPGPLESEPTARCNRQTVERLEERVDPRFHPLRRVLTRAAAKRPACR